MKNNYIHILRECLYSNKVLQKTLFTYSAVLALLGCHLPQPFHTFVMTSVTVFLVIWFICYCRVNKSQEFLKTLPAYNRYRLWARVGGAIVISFPFYAISLLSYFGRIGVQGRYENPLWFTLKSIGIMGAYLLVYKMIIGKNYASPMPSFSRRIKALAVLSTILLISILYYAMRANSRFYESVDSIKHPTYLAPESFTSADNYKCKNTDKVVLNLHLENYDNTFSYAGSLIYSQNELQRKKLLLSEFADSPEWFGSMFLSFDQHNVSIGSILMEEKVNERSLKFNFEHTSSLYYQPTKEHYSATDPWYRRLFSCHPNSILRHRRIWLKIIPYNSSEKLKTLPVDYRSYFRSAGGDYLSTVHRKIDMPYTYGISNYGFVLKKDKRNYILSFKMLYLTMSLILLLGFWSCRFEYGKSFVHLLFTFSFFAFLDYQLVTQRLDFINKMGKNETAVFAAVDLNNSIFFREYAARRLKLCIEADRPNDTQVFNSYKLAWLMLVNKENRVLDVAIVNGARRNFFFDTYDTDNDGVEDLFLEAVQSSPSLNYGKLIDKKGIYLVSRGHLFFLEPDLFSMTDLQKCSKLEAKGIQAVAELRKKAKEDVVKYLKKNPGILAYILHIQFANNYSLKIVELIKGAGYVPKLDEVITVSKEFQLKLALDYLNKK